IPEIPSKVTINEAVELAKKYGPESAASFVNGILDRLLREKAPA
ncbi:MAG: transcription antitermination factor NusB, partial [Nitrospinota bacterium]|nr:transcription antitermination factor NusB [Nitrospinota bacterium]